MTWGGLNPHPPTSDFQVGDRVVVTGKPFGYLKGAHLFHKYLWEGLAFLLIPNGLCCGSCAILCSYRQ